MDSVDFRRLEKRVRFKERERRCAEAYYTYGGATRE